MRPPVDAEKIRALAAGFARVCDQPVCLYLTGGATAVLEGWREATVDVDIRFEPDLDQLFRAIPALKEELQISVELASPPDFVPELPGWRDRSPLVLVEGRIEVRHFDPYSQALSKLERGFDQDLADVEQMCTRGLIGKSRLLELFLEVEDQLYRYPAIEPAGLRARIEAFAAEDG